jgi:hypothetical protein
MIINVSQTMKIMIAIISAIFICSCTSNSITYLNENKQTIWVYGYGDTTPVRGCGILSKGSRAVIISDDRNKFNSDTKVMWTIYNGADTGYFYEATNPVHISSKMKNNKGKSAKDILLVFTADNEWVRR